MEQILEPKWRQFQTIYSIYLYQNTVDAVLCNNTWWMVFAPLSRIVRKTGGSHEAGNLRLKKCTNIWVFLKMVVPNKHMGNSLGVLEVPPFRKHPYIYIYITALRLPAGPSLPLPLPFSLGHSSSQLYRAKLCRESQQEPLQRTDRSSTLVCHPGDSHPTLHGILVHPRGIHCRVQLRAPVLMHHMP